MCFRHPLCSPPVGPAQHLATAQHPATAHHVKPYLTPQQRSRLRSTQLSAQRVREADRA